VLHEKVKNPRRAGAPAREKGRVLRSVTLRGVPKTCLTARPGKRWKEGPGSRSHGGGRESPRGAKAKRASAAEKASTTFFVVRSRGRIKPLESLSGLTFTGLAQRERQERNVLRKKLVLFAREKP
jgi:hypothetical protein